MFSAGTLLFDQTAVAPSSIESQQMLQPADLSDRSTRSAGRPQAALQSRTAWAAQDLGPVRPTTTAPASSCPQHPAACSAGGAPEPWNMLQVTAVSLSCLWPTPCESRETRLFIILHFLHRVIWRSEGRRLAGLTARSRQQSETERGRPTDWAKWKLKANFCALPVSEPTSCQTVKGNQKARGNWSSAYKAQIICLIFKHSSQRR